MQRQEYDVRIGYMHQGMNQLHEALRSDLPEGLSARVADALTLMRARRARMQHAVRMLSAGLSFASFAGLFFSVQAFLQAATASGFTSYASLLVSDSNVIFAHLDLFFDGLAESIPAIESTLVLALVAVFLVSLRSAIGYGVQTRRHFRTA